MIYSEKLNAKFLCRIYLVFHSFNLLPATTNDFQQHLCKHRERRTLQIRAGSFCPLVCLRNRSITKSVSVHWGHLHFFSNSFTCKFFDGFLRAEEAKLSFVCVWRVYNWKLFNYALLVVLEFKGTYFLNRKNRAEDVLA